MAFARYLPVTPALPVTSETCPLPPLLSAVDISLSMCGCHVSPLLSAAPLLCSVRSFALFQLRAVHSPPSQAARPPSPGGDILEQAFSVYWSAAAVLIMEKLTIRFVRLQVPSSGEYFCYYNSTCRCVSKSTVDSIV